MSDIPVIQAGKFGPVVPGSRFQGNAWVFGDNINTDIIIPFRFKARTNDPMEMAQYCMYGVDPDFPKKVLRGDIIVAGKNFGGGSSREQAPVAIKYCGVAAVVADSFSRIFTRNCFAIGLPILEVKGIHGAVVQGDRIDIDLDRMTVKNISGNNTLKARQWPHFLTEILKIGGIQEYYKKYKKFPWE
jgi:3-isopropylmalate/(R)-2-methylmalate dehydratase small subunit